MCDGMDFSISLREVLKLEVVLWKIIKYKNLASIPQNYSDRSRWSLDTYKIKTNEW
jgi:hypothetical protein